MSRFEMISVGVFAFVREPDNPAQVVLVQHAYGEKKWSLPGGKLEQGELVPTGVRREVQEETGLDVEVDQLVGIFTLKKKPGLVILHDVWVIGGEICIHDSEEILQCRYFSIEEALAIKDEIYPAQRAMLAWSESIRLGASPLPIYNFLVPQPPWALPTT